MGSTQAIFTQTNTQTRAQTHFTQKLNECAFGKGKTCIYYILDQRTTIYNLSFKNFLHSLLLFYKKCSAFLTVQYFSLFSSLSSPLSNLFYSLSFNCEFMANESTTE